MQIVILCFQFLFYFYFNLVLDINQKIYVTYLLYLLTYNVLPIDIDFA